MSAANEAAIAQDSTRRNVGDHNNSNYYTTLCFPDLQLRDLFCDDMGKIKKVSVVGAGALGTLIGGLIKYHQPSVEVVLVGRGPHLKAMHQRGTAELRGKWGVRMAAVHATDDREAVRESDLVLFTVKTQDSQSAAEMYAEVCGEAILVSLQNGINQRQLIGHFPSDRLLAGMTATNMTSLEPGVVEFHRDGVSVIGPATSNVSKETLELAQGVLSLSGMRFEIDQQILGVQYNKLLFNTMGYASVLSASDFIRDGLLSCDWRTSVAIPLLREGMRVLKEARVTVKKAPGGSDVLRLRKVMTLLNVPGLNRLANSGIRIFNPPRLVFSVYQDLRRKKPTEIDYVNGEIVRLAQEIGVEAPLNAEVVRVIHELEASGGENFLSHQQVIERFANLRKSL